MPRVKPKARELIASHWREDDALFLEALGNVLLYSSDIGPMVARSYDTCHRHIRTLRLVYHWTKASLATSGAKP